MYKRIKMCSLLKVFYVKWYMDIKKIILNTNYFDKEQGMFSEECATLLNFKICSYVSTL